MQPGYGVPADIRQPHLMADYSSSSVFSISNPGNQTHHYAHHLYQPLPQHPQHSQQQKQPQQFFQQHSIPITHQLFQQQQDHHNHFQAFQQQNERLHQQLRLQHQPGQAPHPFFSLNFKLGLNENSGNSEGLLNQEEDTFVYENGQHVPENRQHSLVMPHCWHPQEDPSIREPFWKPLHKECSEDKEQVDESERCKNLEHKYGLFGELEAIYSLTKIGDTNQAGSGSALTGENSPSNAGISMPFTDIRRPNVGATGVANNTIGGVDHGSETSIGEEASLRKVEKRKRKKKMEEKLSSVAGFFEILVKQVMDHQEGLHRNFLEVIEKMDKCRTDREEAWRRQEAAKYNREAIARAHEQALASSREALIVSFIEKITGDSINLPTRNSQLLLQPENSEEVPIKELTATTSEANSRWPKAEVEALIRVRSGLEPKFQEPGLKGPIWEEISSLMASMGYQRNAKRCKEKWENINKYFRKTKESGKKRPQQSKTCSYFDQLNQLYSRTPISCPSSSKPSSNSHVFGLQGPGYQELLEEFSAEGDLVIAQNPSSGSLNVSKMGSLKLGFDGIVDGKVEHFIHGKEKGNHQHDEDKGCEEEDDDEDNDDDDDDDGEGD